jgi:16S rRNA (guanine527-N7)-methyltransferase
MNQIIMEGAKKLNLNLSEKQALDVATYLSLLQKWNRVFNLTALRHPDQMLTHHVFDSLAVAPFFQKGEACLDVGTGPGLPGIILAIIDPKKHWTLLDSNSKKTSFIQATIQELHLTNIQVVNARIEDFKPDHSFDAIVSRAFASLADFIKLCRHFLAPEGKLIAMKGPKVMEELTRIQFPYQLEKLQVPFLEEQRFVVLITQEACHDAS